MLIGSRRIVGIRVAFWFDAPVEYSGGLNYIRNLLYATSLVNNNAIEPYVFFSRDISASTEAEFSPYATVVRTKLLQRGTFHWLIYRVFYKLLNSMLPVNLLLKHHNIDVVSHVWFPYKGTAPFRIISWIPDFQYLHLPELFPTYYVTEGTSRNQAIIRQSDIVILSSNDALSDFKKIVPPGLEARGKVLPFVSQPNSRLTDAHGALARGAIKARYGIKGEYLFLPNQFWAHKNHMVVLEALTLLKQRGDEVQLVCTGNLRDYRFKNTDYVDRIRKYINDSGLEDNVKILGHIDYEDVLLLMKCSIAVLNPSRFEGWSSTVEEAKSMGKTLILSNIPVHLEQSPLNARYFDPNDAVQLSNILSEVWRGFGDVIDLDAEESARNNLHERTIRFGRSYIDLVKGVDLCK